MWRLSKHAEQRDYGRRCASRRGGTGAAGVGGRWSGGRSRRHVAEVRRFSALCTGRRGWAVGLRDAEANGGGAWPLASEPVRRAARVGRQALVASPPVREPSFFFKSTPASLCLWAGGGHGLLSWQVDGRKNRDVLRVTMPLDHRSVGQKLFR